MSTHQDSITARLHSFNETIRIKQLFDDVIDRSLCVNKIFDNLDVNKDTKCLDRLLVISLTNGQYRIGFAQAAIKSKPMETTTEDCDYQEHTCDSLDQVCEFLMKCIANIPWFEKAVATIKEQHCDEKLIDGIKYIIKGECIGSEGAISLYHLFNGKWMWFNSLTGENDIAESFDFKHGKVQTILVRAGLREPISTFVFE